jgi:hypothetical protein
MSDGSRDASGWLVEWSVLRNSFFVDARKGELSVLSEELVPGLGSEDSVTAGCCVGLRVTTSPPGGLTLYSEDR